MSQLTDASPHRPQGGQSVPLKQSARSQNQFGIMGRTSYTHSQRVLPGATAVSVEREGPTSSFRNVPNEIIRYIHDIAPNPNFSPVCKLWHRLTHLSSVFCKNVPNDKVIRLFMNAGTENLRMFFTENSDPEAMKGMLEKLTSVRCLQVTVLSPSIPFLVELQKWHKILKTLAIHFRSYREFPQKMAETAKLISVVSSGLRKYSINFTNCEITGFDRQILPHLAIPEKLESFAMDAYRNTLTRDDIMAMLDENLKLHCLQELKEIKLDFSADKCHDPMIDLGSALFNVQQALKKASFIPKITLILTDNDFGVEDVKTIMGIFASNEHLRSLTLILNRNPIGNEGVQVVVNNLPPNLKVLDLHLQEVGLNDDGKVHLEKLAKECKSLDRLKINVCHNFLHDSVVDGLLNSKGDHLASYELNASWQLC